MATPFITSLPQDTQRQLKLCGITTDTQLATGIAAKLHQELQAAKELFPEEDIRLTETELDALIQKARELNGIPEERKEYIPPAIEKPKFLPIEEELEINDPEQEEAQQAAETEAFLGQLKRSGKHKGERRPITCGHPFLLLFGAFATILVPFFILSLIGLPYILLLSDFRPLGEDEIVYILVAFSLVIPHLATVRMVHCSVCHMHTFTFRNYPHHSKAHRLPLLGVPISTALRIIFFLRFTCPACGTEQKLFGKRSHLRHSHRSNS